MRTASGSYSVHTQRVKGSYGLLRLTGGKVERVPTVQLGVERGGTVICQGRGEATQSRTRGNVDWSAGVVKNSNERRPWQQRDLLLFFPFLCFSSSWRRRLGRGKIPRGLGFAAADWGLL